VRAVDPVAHVGRRGQRLKSMQKPWRHIQIPKVVIIEKEGLLPAESRRIPTNVDEHVVNGSMCTPNQLRLAAPGPAVHTADYTFRRTRLGVLHEGSGQSRPAEVFIEDVRVEGSGEEAAVIVERTRHENENVCKISTFDTHEEMLS
jgi:hypothetical protein